GFRVRIFDQFEVLTPSRAVCPRGITSPLRSCCRRTSTAYHGPMLIQPRQEPFPTAEPEFIILDEGGETEGWLVREHLRPDGESQHAGKLARNRVPDLGIHLSLVPAEFVGIRNGLKSLLLRGSERPRVPVEWAGETAIFGL